MNTVTDFSHNEFTLMMSGMLHERSCGLPMS